MLNKIFLICSIFTTFTVSCMNLSVNSRQQKRRSLSAPPTLQNGTTTPYKEAKNILQNMNAGIIRMNKVINDMPKEMDAAINRGLQNAQGKLAPMVNQMLAESSQRIAQSMGQNTIPPTVTAEDTDDIRLVILRDLLTKNIEILANLKNNPLIPKKYAKDINQLLIANDRVIQLGVMSRSVNEKLQNTLTEADRAEREFKTQNAAHQTRMAEIERKTKEAQAEYGIIPTQPTQLKQEHKQEKDIFMNCCIYIGIPLAIILPVLGFLMHRATI